MLAVSNKRCFGTAKIGSFPKPSFCLHRYSTCVSCTSSSSALHCNHRYSELRARVSGARSVRIIMNLIYFITVVFYFIIFSLWLLYKSAFWAEINVSRVQCLFIRHSVRNCLVDSAGVVCSVLLNT
jgi:hypothetical protein